MAPVVDIVQRPTLSVKDQAITILKSRLQLPIQLASYEIFLHRQDKAQL